MRDIFKFQDFFWNIIKFGRCNYCLIQYSCSFIHYFTGYGHFKFDIKRFCAFTLIFCVKIEFIKSHSLNIRLNMSREGLETRRPVCISHLGRTILHIFTDSTFIRVFGYGESIFEVGRIVVKWFRRHLNMTSAKSYSI